MIPECVLLDIGEDDDDIEMKDKKKLEIDIEREEGRDYILDLNKRYILKNKAENYDIVPEIYNGKNVIDFVDINVKEKVEKIKIQELERERNDYYNLDLKQTEEDLNIHELAKK